MSPFGHAASHAAGDDFSRALGLERPIPPKCREDRIPTRTLVTFVRPLSSDCLLSGPPLAYPRGGQRRLSSTMCGLRGMCEIRSRRGERAGGQRSRYVPLILLKQLMEAAPDPVLASLRARASGVRCSLLASRCAPWHEHTGGSARGAVAARALARARRSSLPPLPAKNPVSPSRHIPLGCGGARSLAVRRCRLTRIGPSAGGEPASPPPQRRVDSAVRRRTAGPCALGEIFEGLDGSLEKKLSRQRAVLP